MLDGGTCSLTAYTGNEMQQWRITNVGNGVMVSLLWASELFDRSRPDTVLMPV